uniref:Putative secreted protein n=1 Tax=Anopheles darlingi TaxID=43151 RepID=A0A2M4D584_ANODA
MTTSIVPVKRLLRSPCRGRKQLLPLLLLLLLLLLGLIEGLPATPGSTWNPQSLHYPVRTPFICLASSITTSFATL